MHTLAHNNATSALLRLTEWFVRHVLWVKQVSSSLNIVGIFYLNFLPFFQVGDVLGWSLERERLSTVPPRFGLRFNFALASRARVAPAILVQPPISASSDPHGPYSGLE